MVDYILYTNCLDFNDLQGNLEDLYLRENQVTRVLIIT